jgi:hypothetical protein
VPLFTIVFRSLVAFLSIEGVLVLMAVIIIKATEELRKEGEEETEETSE